jgi:cell migration-inducing and hyaluronan-binding protein
VPVVISRNGNEFISNGETNVRAGSEYTVTTEGDSVNIRVMELDAGSWVMFELPGFTTAAAGNEQGSLDALRNASETSWFKGNDALWVKIVSTADIAGRRPRDTDSLLISR